MTKRSLKKIERSIVTLQVLMLFAASIPQPAQAQIEPTAVYLPANSVDSVRKVLAESDATLPDLPAKPRATKRTLWVTVTAYSSTVDQTDSDPFTTASGAKVRDGIIAWNGVPFGTELRLPSHFGDKVFVVKDRLNPRASRYHVDIWMPTREAAKQWGARVVKAELL